MAKHCDIHTDVELVTVTYCPACRGGAGGAIAAKNSTKAERSRRAKKAARARWAKKKTGGTK